MLRLFFAVGASAAGSMITAILSEISTFRVQPGKLVLNLVDQIRSGEIFRDIFKRKKQLDIHTYYEPSSRHGSPDTAGEAYLDNPESSHSEEASAANWGHAEESAGFEANGAKNPGQAYEDGNTAHGDDEDDDGFLEVVEPGSRNGKSAALVGIFSGIGACFAVFVLMSLPIMLDKEQNNPSKSLRISYYIVASIAVFISGVLYLGMHEDRTKSLRQWVSSIRKAKSPMASSMDIMGDDESYISLLKQGFSIALTEKQIALAYMGGFVARSTTVATVMFIPLVINVYFHNEGRCSGSIHDPTSELKTSCPKAYLISVIVTGVSQTASLVFAPLWGFTTDRFGRKATLLCSSVVGFIGFLGFGCISDPTRSAAVYVFGVMMGIAQIGTIIASMSLCTDTKRSSSGAIAGVYSFCGGIGILFLSKLGGWLSDLWAGAPFVILSLFYVALIAATLWQMPEFLEKVFGFLQTKRFSSGRIRLDESEDDFISYD